MLSLRSVLNFLRSRLTKEHAASYFSRCRNRPSPIHMQSYETFLKILRDLLANKPLPPQSKWMYTDGSIVPISAYKGVKLTRSQISDYVYGKTIRIDGCQGNPSTVYIKFDPARMVPAVYSSNADTPHQSKTVPSQGAGITLSMPSFRGSNQDDEGFDGGKGISDDFKIWLNRHPGLSIDEALHRYRDEQKAKQRRNGSRLH